MCFKYLGYENNKHNSYIYIYINRDKILATDGTKSYLSILQLFLSFLLKAAIARILIIYFLTVVKVHILMKDTYYALVALSVWNEAITRNLWLSVRVLFTKAAQWILMKLCMTV
jgi:hypothetical protein